MSIKTRVDDAEHLWAEGRKEGAWVQALIAAAATARKRYPRLISDNKAFKSFICDVASVIMTGSTDGSGPIYIEFYSDKRGDGRKLEDIFYTDLRCNLLHEGELKEVGFSESRLEGGRYEGTLSVASARVSGDTRLLGLTFDRGSEGGVREQRPVRLVYLTVVDRATTS